MNSRWAYDGSLRAQRAGMAEGEWETALIGERSLVTWPTTISAVANGFKSSIGTLMALSRVYRLLKIPCNVKLHSYSSYVHYCTSHLTVMVTTITSEGRGGAKRAEREASLQDLRVECLFLSRGKVRTMTRVPTQSLLKATCWITLDLTPWVLAVHLTGQLLTNDYRLAQWLLQINVSLNCDFY